MASLVVRTGKLTDKQLVQIIGQLLDWFPAGEARVGFASNSVITARSVEEVKFVIGPDSDTKTIITFEFLFPDSVREVVSFHRGTVESERWVGNPNRSGFNPAVPSATFDEIAFLDPSPGHGQQERNYLDTKHVVVISNFIQKFASILDATSDDDSKKLSKIVSRQTDDLRKLYLEMAEGFAKNQAKADLEFSKRQAALEEAFVKRTAQLDSQEADLERRRLELNDREPQHERRRLREILTTRLQDNLANPIRGRRAEDRAHYIYLFVGALFITISSMLTMFSDIRDVSASPLFWSHTAKSVASGIAGAAFIWAGLAGLKAAAVATRKYEESMLRYGFDMDRASWVVETILQMNSAEKSEVPTEWLESVCRDLFAANSDAADDHKSLDAFAALFDATARAKIGTSGIEFELDRKGAKKLALEGR